MQWSGLLVCQMFLHSLYNSKALQNFSATAEYICSDHATDKLLWDFTLIRTAFCLILFLFLVSWNIWIINICSITLQGNQWSRALKISFTKYVPGIPVLFWESLLESLSVLLMMWYWNGNSSGWNLMHYCFWKIVQPVVYVCMINCIQQSRLHFFAIISLGKFGSGLPAFLVALQQMWSDTVAMTSGALL